MSAPRDALLGRLDHTNELTRGDLPIFAYIKTAINTHYCRLN